jgi:hypothetical protein
MRELTSLVAGCAGPEAIDGCPLGELVAEARQYFPRPSFEEVFHGIFFQFLFILKILILFFN